MGKDKHDTDWENASSQDIPPYGPYGYPYYPPYPPHPAMHPPAWPHCPPMWHPMYGHPPMGGGMPPQPQRYHQPGIPPQDFDWGAQAQGMVEGMMGEQASLFKKIISTIGVDDKEFWKGAMIGAAAALILGNESVRNTLLQTVTNAGDLLKAGGGKVKDAAGAAAESVKESAKTGSEIFRDTVTAGKEGFQESVARHRQTDGDQGADDE